MLLLGLAVMFALLYLGLQVYYLFYWQKTPVAEAAPDVIQAKGVTVVLIARNEARLIGSCLQSLLQQDFPSHLMEIIVIDDHSEDETATIVQSFHDPRISLYALKDFPDYIHPPAFKKSAITLAVDRAQYDTIMVTDADCHHPAAWLSTAVYHFQQRNAAFQTGPVMITRGDTMLERLQETEQMLFMIITGAGITSALHDIASGANMTFSKKAFQAVGGYKGNEHYASGDDMFLIEKMRDAFPDQIYFLKSLHATVTTDGKKTWPDLFNQRLRWAGKNKGLQNSLINRIWLFVGLYHILMVISLILALLCLVSWWSVWILFGVKWLTDYLLLRNVATYFQKQYLLRQFIPLQFLYGYYLVALGILMIMGKKGDWQRK